LLTNFNKHRLLRTFYEGSQMPERILVIEDDEATLYSYERALLDAGYLTKGYPGYSEAAEDIDRGVGRLLIIDLQLAPHTPNGLAQ
jgi:DNA-binding NtrC family response regulator